MLLIAETEFHSVINYTIKNLYQKPTFIIMEEEDIVIFTLSLLGVWIMLEFLTFLVYGSPFILTQVTVLIAMGASAQITMLWIAQHIPSKDEIYRLNRDLRMLKLNVLSANYGKLNPYPHFFS